MGKNECSFNQSVERKEPNIASAPYKYDVLPTNSIRILSLPPGDRSARLQGELHPAAVPGSNSPWCVSEPTFEALSYAWGDGNLCQTIFCSNSAIKITQSLFDALIHLRHPEATRKLWVDALCIDQNNNDEKTEQIPHMKDIYQHADQVVIWLGLADKSTIRALDLIRLAANCLWQECGQSMPTRDVSRFMAPFSDKRNRQWGFPPRKDMESWLSVAAFFKRSWFYRCWTFQEAVLATKASIQIGAHLLDWGDLCVASTFLFCMAYSLEVKIIVDGVATVCRLCSCTRIGLGMQQWTPMPLMHLLLTTMDTQAKLPKDRIFGLLALTGESTQKYFSLNGSLDNPKYNMSMRELCTDVSLFYLHNNESESEYEPLEILNVVKHYPLEEGEQEKRNKDDGGLIPSWVQRWHDPIPKFKNDREENEVQPMFVIPTESDTANFRTGGPEYHAPECNPQTPYEISLHGFLFAPISNTVNILRLPPVSRSRLWDLVLETRSIREERHASYPTGESIDEVFALTLTMAMKPRFAHEAETYHAIDFQHFCIWLYELTLTSLIEEGQINDHKRLEIEWMAEYQRLKSLVGTHVTSPTFWTDLQSICRGRKLFSTLSGHIGIGDVTLEPGDMVCVLLGGKTPFIIRPVDQKYRFVGE